jgi:hypothetical protein
LFSIFKNHFQALAAFIHGKNNTGTKWKHTGTNIYQQTVAAGNGGTPETAMASQTLWPWGEM